MEIQFNVAHVKLNDELEGKETEFYTYDDDERVWVMP